MRVDGGKIKARLRQRWLDVLLLLVSAACFTEYLRGTERASVSQDSALSRIGILKSGSALRKGLNTPDFEEVLPGGIFWHLDVVWVGKGKTATLLLENQLALNLEERTLAILKRPFKAGSSPRAEDQIKLVQGKVRVAREAGEKILQQENLFEELPRKSSGEKNGSGRVLPAEDTLFLVRGKTSREIPFFWTEPLEGILVVRNESSGQIIYRNIRQLSGTKVALDPGAVYAWQVVGEDKQPRLGPYRFEIQLYDNAALPRMLKARQKRPVQFYWSMEGDR